MEIGHFACQKARIKAYIKFIDEKARRVEVKESLIVEDLDNQIKVKKELVKAKLMLEKFTTSRNKLDEILAIGMRDLGMGGLRYVDKRKVVIQNPTSFVKASSSSDSSECSNLVLIKNNKKVIPFHRVVCYYCVALGHTKPWSFNMLHNLMWTHVVLKEVPTSTSVLKKKK
ncbi:hypothetical protein Goari_025069 [Gossypium aridum]|uniref:Uncharacterized protein n=1 Tax=Gossypium aridum TaxID=34290 RepID=A0A7J8X7Z2_GOSAI|nr:hypothetical protein [Gossypium aridum]